MYTLKNLEIILKLEKKIVKTSGNPVYTKYNKHIRNNLIKIGY